MGRTVTPKYRVEYRDNLLSMGRTRPDAVSRVDRKAVNIMAWKAKEDGRANAENLAKWRNGFNASFQADGSNAHLAEAFGAIPHIHFARIVRQSDDSVVAEFTAPMFEVV